MIRDYLAFTALNAITAHRPDARPILALALRTLWAACDFQQARALRHFAHRIAGVRIAR